MNLYYENIQVVHHIAAERRQKTRHVVGKLFSCRWNMLGDSRPTSEKLLTSKANQWTLENDFVILLV